MPTSSEPNEFLQEVAVETTESCSSPSSRNALGLELQVEEATPSRGGDTPIDKDLTLVITPSKSREKDFGLKVDLEPRNVHLDAAIVLAEPAIAHPHIDSSYSEPGLTHSNPTLSCSPPSSTQTNCSNAADKPTLTQSAVRPHLITGSFPARCSQLPPKARNLASRAMTITEWGVGRQFHLLPVVSMFLTILRPIRYKV